MHAYAYCVGALCLHDAPLAPRNPQVGFRERWSRATLQRFLQMHRMFLATKVLGSPLHPEVHVVDETGDVSRRYPIVDMHSRQHAFPAKKAPVSLHSCPSTSSADVEMNSNFDMYMRYSRRLGLREAGGAFGCGAAVDFLRGFQHPCVTSDTCGRCLNRSLCRWAGRLDTLAHLFAVLFLQL